MDVNTVPVTGLNDDIRLYKEAYRILEKGPCKRYAGLTPVDLAVARLKRMLLEGVFSFTYTVRLKDKTTGKVSVENVTLDLSHYVPSRKTGLMTSADEETIQLVLDEAFPEESADKNTYLRPYDLHVANAVAQVLVPYNRTASPAVWVVACVRLMAAEWTLTWKKPHRKAKVRRAA